MTRINVKRPFNHVPNGQIHGVIFEPGEQDVHPTDAATLIREGVADPLAPAPDDEGAGTAGNGQTDPVAPSPDSGPAAPSSASPPAPASRKPRRKPAAKRKPPAKPG